MWGRAVPVHPPRDARVLAENGPDAVAEHVGCSADELWYERFPHPDVRSRPPLGVPGGYSAVREIDVPAAAD